MLDNIPKYFNRINQMAQELSSNSATIYSYDKNSTEVAE